MTITALISDYLLACRANGCRPATLRHYRDRLSPLDAAYGPREATDLTRDELIAWCRAATAGKAPDTVRATVSSLLRLQQHAIDLGALPAPWVERRQLPRGGSRQRSRMPSDAEASAILSAGPPEFAAIYEALLLTGARPAELCAARLEQVEPPWNILAPVRSIVLAEHKTSRSGVPRRIPLGPQVAPLIEAARAGRSTGPIFLAPGGQAWTRDRLSRMFRRLRRRLGLDESLVLYATRHRFGTQITRRPPCSDTRPSARRNDTRTSPPRSW